MKCKRDEVVGKESCAAGSLHQRFGNTTTAPQHCCRCCGDARLGISQGNRNKMAARGCAFGSGGTRVLFSLRHMDRPTGRTGLHVHPGHDAPICVPRRRDRRKAAIK